MDTWLRSQEHLGDDGDAIDLLDLVTEILQDEKITEEELEQFHNLTDDILEYKKLSFADNEAKINELIGILKGIAADNHICDEEIQTLRSWTIQNQELAEIWPFDVVSTRVENILEDGVVTKTEREDLLETVKQITGDRFEESGLTCGLATEFFEDPIDNLTVNGKCFCFTGKFVTGSRDTVEKSMEQLGAEVRRNLSKKVDYLVIGTMASRDWRYSSHGRKIEAALKLKNKGSNISILTERSWLKHI